MSPTQIHNPRILITDDNPVNIQVASSTLQPLYSHLLEARDGEACLELLKKQSVDLLLLDMNMPKLSGMQVLQMLPNLPRNRQPRVMVVSSDDSPETVAEAFQMGADDYLTTPYSQEEMLARVQTQLALRSRAQYLEDLVASRTRELSEANQRLKQTHQQLMQTEKMASLGQLAAGIAHEINNPIAYINSNLQTLMDYCNDFRELLELYTALPEDLSTNSHWQSVRNRQQQINSEFLLADAQTLLTDSLKGVERVTRIATDLKVFSHPEQINWQSEDLHACIDSALNIVASKIKYKATVTKHYGDIPAIDCILPQMNQVLVNLLINAAQSIEEFGDICITTQKHNDDCIQLIIEDTGTGISHEHIDKIYDPFFTTKPVGEGTGLGLSISYSIIQNHGGQIEAISRPKNGTQFILTLPIRQITPSKEQCLQLQANNSE